MPARVFLTPTSFGNVQNTFGRTESFGTARQIQLAVRYSLTQPSTARNRRHAKLSRSHAEDAIGHISRHTPVTRPHNHDPFHRRPPL